MQTRTPFLRTALPCLFVLLALLVASSCVQAQISPGVIIRACTDATGRSILSPNYTSVSKTFGTTTYHYASASNAGWTLNGDDTSLSVNNVPYRAIASYCGEPCCDLRRGPDHRYSDIVYDKQNNGVYMYYDSTNRAFLFRFRMGDIIPGAKGFSLLIDTDLKWGSTGASADPNYRAQTTGINGNRGYELELVLESGFRVALYNVDGMYQPSDNIRQTKLLWSSDVQNPIKNWTDYSQIVMAATTEFGDPDYFLDFYIPSSAFWNSGYFPNGYNQKVRIIPTTVMAPKPSTAGPISDIYGCDDSTTIINQPPICIGCNAPTGICTPAPYVNSVGITSGTTATISGTWIADSKGSRNATIYIYKNGDTTTAIGTTTVANISYPASNSWSVNVSGLVVGDVITAKAQGVNGTYAYESRWCYTSNSRTVTACSGSVPVVSLDCISTKGAQGTGYPYGSGNYVRLYRTTGSTMTLVSSGIPGTTTGWTTTAAAGTATGTLVSWVYSGGCGNNGSAQLNEGAYYVVDSTTAGCLSGYSFNCNATGTGNSTAAYTQVPTLTSPTSVTTSTTTISGGFGATGTAPTSVRVFRDSVLLGFATLTGSPATAWSYNLGNVTLSSGQEIMIRANTADAGSGGSTTRYCAGVLKATVATPACSNTAPVINIDSLTSVVNGGNYLVPRMTLAGTATPGATVKVYTNTNTLVGTATAKTTSGYWTLSDSARSTVTSYYATVTTAGCATAATSGNYIVSPSNTDSRYCGGGISFSTDAASSSGTYYSVFDANGNAVQTTINGVAQSQPFYSDATYLKGTFPSGVTAPASSRVSVYVNDVLVNSYTLATGSNSWGPISVAGALYQGAILTISVSESGNRGEYTCASQKIICACAVTNTPEAPVLSAYSQTSVASGRKAKIVIKNPKDNYFYRLYNSSGVAISDGVWYNSSLGSPVVGRVLATDSITINSYTVTATTQADVKALYVGGTESCTSTTQKTITFLPISLLEFQGQRTGKTNQISWRTAEELNAAYFQLERSADGVTFEAIARLQTSGSNSSYSYTDLLPAAGDNFYRLRMVDADGRFRHSNVILLRNDASASVTLEAARPNPFAGEITFSVFLPEGRPVTARLMDLSGRPVLRREFKGVRGTNDLVLSGLSSLPAGVYLLQVAENGTVHQVKLLHVTR